MKALPKYNAVNISLTKNMKHNETTDKKQRACV